MMTLLHEGGAPAWFVLLFGILALGGAAWFVRRPHDAALTFQRAMTWVMFATMLGGFAAGVRASIGGLERLPPHLRDQWHTFLLAGVRECLGIVVLGTALLALSWMVTAVGVRRRADDVDADVSGG